MAWFCADAHTLRVSQSSAILDLHDCQKDFCSTGFLQKAGEPERYNTKIAAPAQAVEDAMLRIDLHAKFELAFSGRVGDVLSREQIKQIIQIAFPEMPVPTDHAESSSDHANQCCKCADDAYRIFDTVLDGKGKPNRARYRVRAFQRLSARDLR